MGSKWSKKPTKNPSDSSGDVDEQERNTKARCWASPYVLTRQGSMYIDEDGDMAHEFYEEVPDVNNENKITMKKITTNLTPQGEIQHEFPRLNVDFPVVIAER